MKRFNLHNIWQKIWGKDIPPAEDLFPDDLYAYYNPVYLKMVRKQRTKRFFVGFIILIVGFNLIGDLITTIKNIPLIACLGKEVCIYRGPKLNYPSPRTFSHTLNDGNLFIIGISRGYNYNYHKITSFVPRKLLNLLLFIHFDSFDKKFDKLIPGYRNWSFELYDLKTKKMMKLSNLNVLNFQTKSENEDYLITKEQILKFDKNAQTITDINSIKTFGHNDDLDVYKFYLGPYKNNILMVTNYNKVFYIDALNALTLKYGNKLDDRLLEFDVKNFKYKIFPKFAVKPKFFPYLKDLIILDNGKIILPIRTLKCKNEFPMRDCHIIYDHIEIYDPETNSFVAEFNNDVLNYNLFRINLPDGNILFINKNSSYIFDNKTNQFIKTQKQDEEKYQAAVSKIQQYLYDLMRIDFGENILSDGDKIKIIPLNNEKYLITCGDIYYLHPYYKKQTCRQTVYYNFTKNEVKLGPKFLYPLYRCRLHNQSPNELMAVCGSTSFGNDYNVDLPYQFIQIIKYKN